jgi:nucleoside-diphosphate-sugar epimerase
MKRILVIGANGQLGTELVEALRLKYGRQDVIASDLNQSEKHGEGIFEELDVMDKARLASLIEQYQINEIYHLAAILSGNAEKNPAKAWELNMQGLFNILELAKVDNAIKIYWPSSIGVFGPTTPKQNTPQETVTEPNTVYGISKLAGERWCAYYHEHYGVDVRSLRYPGLIGYKTLPGGGTTDYAVDIFYKAIQGEAYDCFLKRDTTLPMMYIEDAVKATMEIMEAPISDIQVRSSYNLAAFSFSPQELFDKIKLKYPDFTITHTPDFRQDIADSWPASIDDAPARADWGWHPDYNLDALVEVMIENLKLKLVHH